MKLFLVLICGVNVVGIGLGFVCLVVIDYGWLEFWMICLLFGCVDGVFLGCLC